MLCATYHAVVSQKHHVLVEELLNHLEMKIMINIEHKMEQLEDRLISKISPTLEKRDTEIRVNITFLSMIGCYTSRTMSAKTCANMDICLVNNLNLYLLEFLGSKLLTTNQSH